MHTEATPRAPSMRHGFTLLLRLTWASKGYFAVAIGGGIIYALLQIATSALIGRATEEAIIPSFQAGEPLVAATWSIALLIIAVAILRSLTLVARRVYTMYAVYDIMEQMRSDLLSVFARTHLQWHRNRSTGTLLSAVYADTEAAMQALIPWAFAVATAFMLVYVVIMVALTDWVILLVLVGVLTAMIGLNVMYQIKVAPVVMNIQTERAVVSDIAHESFDGANVVKALGRENDEEQRFSEATDRLRDHGVLFGYIRGWFDPLIDALPNIGIIAFACLGAYRIADGHLSTGELVEISYLFTLMAVPIRSFGWVLSNLARTVVGYERVQRVLDADIEDYGGTQSLATNAAPSTLEFDGVCLQYDDEDGTDPREAGAAIIDVSFTAGPTHGTRTLAVVGSTGSGKSTLTLLASRLLAPTKGRILLDGVPMDQLSDEALHGSVALVLQQAFLFDGTVRENVTLGAHVSDETIWWALRIAQADEFVRALDDGLETRLAERGGSLSGGQRQRLALARALVRRPRLLILDDATSACDPAVEAAILAGIREHMTDSTLLVVAYRKATIAIADDVVFMSHGRVQAVGSHEELSATNPAYAALVNAYDEASIAHDLLEADREIERSKPHYNMGTDQDAKTAARKGVKTGQIPVIDSYAWSESRDAAGTNHDDSDESTPRDTDAHAPHRSKGAPAREKGAGA